MICAGESGVCDQSHSERRIEVSLRDDALRSDHPLVANIITNPPGEGKYLAVKERLVTVLGEANATQIRKLLGHKIGDEKPFVFLQKLRNLAAG